MKRHSRSHANDNNLESDLQRTRVKTKRHLIKKYFVEYTANSNLHGLKYIGEKEGTPVEKYFWLIVFSCSIVLCGFLIRNLYNKWDRSPVIVSFAENTTPIWKIPYPAVTVCFETKSLQTRFNYTKYYHLYKNGSAYLKLTEDERRMYEDTDLLCNNLFMEPISFLDILTKSNFFTPDIKRSVENIKEVAPKISEFMNFCAWRGKMESCEFLFSPILTEDGLCYTFNMMGAQELFRLENMHKQYEHLESNKSSQSWSTENGYDSSAPLETYPHRGVGHGPGSGLSINFVVDKSDLDYACTGPVQGYKIFLHNPLQLPRTSQGFYRVPLSREVNLAMTPQVMTTSDGLISYASFQRKCYFQKDRYLRYFKDYSQKNCAIECLANYTYVRCGCVHFGMPHAPNMQVCGLLEQYCVKLAEIDLVEAGIRLNSNTNENDTLDEGETVASECKCLPACSSIEYKADISQVYYNAEAVYKAFKWDFDQDKKISSVHIFFEEEQFIGSKRSELYGRTDFLANCGGLLGLCMGFSILSVAEIIYFLTLRIVMWHKRNSKKTKHICE